MGWVLNTRLGRSSIAAARTAAAELMQEAQRKAEAEHKATLLSAKDEWYRTAKQLEREARDRQRNLQRLQKEVEETQAALQESTAQARCREQAMRERERRCGGARARIQEKAASLEGSLEANERLEKISGLTVDEAKGAALRTCATRRGSRRRS